MSAPVAPQVQAVLNQVSSWPAESRFELAQQILQSLPRRRISKPPMTMKLEDVIGILATDAPPPTDEECERILEEERMRKYGG